MKTFTLPAVYKQVAMTLQGRIAIEHADLDFKTTENLLYISIAQLLQRGPELVFLIDKDEKFRWAFEDFKGQAQRKQIKSVCRYEFAQGNIWTCQSLRDLPIEPSYIIIPEANTFEINPITASYQNVIAAGVISERGHWFYHYCREEETKFVKADWLAVISSYPEEKKRVPAQTAAEFPRMMALKDELIEVPPFRVFAKRHLKVRTDKGKEFLTLNQQREAEIQLGKGWHSGASGAPLVTFELNALQKLYLAKKRWWRQRNVNKILLLKYRRGGFTTIEQGINYSIIRSRQRSQVATVAHTEKSTKRIFRIAHLFHELDKRAPKTVNESREGIEFANGSYFFIGTAGGRGGFRGDTLQRVHGSEVAFWCEGPSKQEKVEEVTAAILGAASRGEIVFETTPNGIEWFATTYKEAKAGKNDWGYVFLRWFDDPSNLLLDGMFIEEELRDTLTEKEKFLMIQHKLSLNQIAFRRKVYKDYKRLAPQEFPEDDESCFIVGGTCFFDVQALLDWIDEQNTHFEEPHVEHVSGGAITIWEQPQAGVKYVAGCDTSEGLPGCDYNGTAIMRKDNGAQVAKVYGLFRPPQLAELTVALCTRYNNALLGIEREAYGSAVLQKVKELGYNRPHFRGGPLYYFKKSKSKAGQRSGWDTNSVTRPAMLDALYEYVEHALDEYGILRDREFVGECLTFRLQGNGKFEADSGAHDDCVMMWAIANQMRLVHVPRMKFYTDADVIGSEEDEGTGDE